AVLARYTRAAWTAAWGTGRADALLALVVLNKRALSSASSLYTSVERRLRLLAEPAVDWRQPGFRFDEDGEADADDEAPVAIGCPALADTTREREYLEALAAAAGRAAGGESKLAALRRLLRRIDEPAIVFTEFRDTLAHVARTLPSQQAAILHGGLTRGERIAAEQAFVSGATPLLLATDAAGEGLNLQARCRFVINLELPWNPRRLEQRIGRVDRIGQRGVVHALHLVARDTGEARVLARLAWKLERARDALGAIAADAVGLSERELLGAMVGRRDAPAVLPEAVEAPVSTPPLVRQVSLRAEAEREAREVQTLRRIQAGAAPAARLQPEIIARHLAALDRSAPLIGVARRGALSRLTGGPGLLVVYRVRIVTDAGRAVEEALIPITCATGPGTASRSPQVQRVLVEALLRQPPAALARLVDERVAWHLDIVRAGCRPRLSLLAERERLMAAHADAMADLAGQLVQQGLFDRRAVRDAARQARERLHDRKSAAGRLAAVEADGLLRLAAAPEPVLVLFVAGESRGRSSHTARGDGR
ncbi:MAG TPA: helicase-related protein, partial [Vicinamibacterales bacterium]|nr:helicase-related protein [Vicinamibacterales bacterium]